MRGHGSYMPLKLDYKPSETRDTKDKPKEIILHGIRAVAPVILEAKHLSTWHCLYTHFATDMLTYLEIKLILKHQYIG